MSLNVTHNRNLCGIIYADWLSVTDRNIGKWIKRSHKKDFSAIDSFKQIFDSTDDKPDDKSNDSIQRSNEWKKALTMFGVANMTQWIILYDSKNRFQKRFFFSALDVFFNFLKPNLNWFWIKLFNILSIYAIFLRVEKIRLFQFKTYQNCTRIWNQNSYSAHSNIVV